MGCQLWSRFETESPEEFPGWSLESPTLLRLWLAENTDELTPFPTRGSRPYRCCEILNCHKEQSSPYHLFSKLFLPIILEFQNKSMVAAVLFGWFQIHIR